MGAYSGASSGFGAATAQTPALRAIPGHEPYVAQTIEINPGGRLTTTEDVANVLLALADPAVTWISGTVIRVDRGKAIVG